MSKHYLLPKPFLPGSLVHFSGWRRPGSSFRCYDSGHSLPYPGLLLYQLSRWSLLTLCCFRLDNLPLANFSDLHFVPVSINSVPILTKENIPDSEPDCLHCVLAPLLLVVCPLANKINFHTSVPLSVK